MKNIFTILIITLAVNTLNCQVNTKNKLSRLDSIEYKINYVQYNLGKFHKQFKTGLYTTAAGSAILIIGASLKPEKLETTEGTGFNERTKIKNDYIQNIVIGAAGGVIAIVGIVMVLNSYKWIKRASIEPSIYGATLKINF
jgi:hypothetical protein